MNYPNVYLQYITYNDVRTAKKNLYEATKNIGVLFFFFTLFVLQG